MRFRIPQRIWGLFRGLFLLGTIMDLWQSRITRCKSRHDLKEYLLEGYALNSKRLEELGKVAHFIEQGSQNETLGLPAKTAPPFSAAPVPHGQPRTVRR